LLIEVFGGNLSGFPQSIDTIIKECEQISRMRTRNNEEKLITRKQEIFNLLLIKGPLTRREIVEHTGMPRGSAATLYDNKKTFFSKDGKWYLVDDKEKKEAQVP
jgi:hypothetical protein